MQAERDALHRHCFGDLQSHCQSHGARFQVVDLRWGVSPQAVHEQKVLDICLNEVRRCQQLTSRPNFIVLLGEQYGTQLLPPRVAADDFLELCAVAPHEDEALLRHWYRRDDNAVPPEFVLRPRQGEFADDAVWARQEDQLLRAWSNGLQRVGWPATDARHVRYAGSVTAHEVQAGPLSAPAQSAQAQAYLRRATQTPDPRLAELRQLLVRALPADHVQEYDGCDLFALCRLVRLGLQRQIDQELAQLQRLSMLQLERHRQHAFALARSLHFVGREAELRQIRDYLADPARQDHAPLFLVGPSGQGKTALLARAALESAENATVQTVFRFVGATPASATLPALLAQLGQDIAASCQLDWAGRPQDGVAQLSSLLGELLRQLPPDRRLVICLDALDQLPDDDGNTALVWLPATLPAGVRLLVTALERPGEPVGPIVQLARQRFVSGAFLTLPPLESLTMARMLDANLAEAGRTLQPAQRQLVVDAATRVGAPMYMKLIGEQCRDWRSFDPLPAEPPRTLRGLVEHHLETLAQDAAHGRVLVATALGLLAAARHGLGDDEMLEVLGMDAQVVEALRARSRQEFAVSPGLGVRVPDIFWFRLRFDLHGYLSEREADGVVLNCFYHRSVSEVAARRYLNRQRHQRLAAFFLRQPLICAGTANLRKLAELPYQLRMAGMHDALETLLADQDFIRALVDARGLSAYLVEAQLAYVDMRSSPNPGTRGDALPEALFAFVLRQLKKHDLDIEDIHAVLVYQDDTSFYGAFLGIARAAPGRERAAGQLGAHAAAELQARLSLRYANLLRRGGDLTTVGPIFEQVRAFYQDKAGLSRQNSKELSTACYESGYLSYLKGDFAAAARAMQESAELARRGGHMTGYWFSRCVRGNILFFVGQVTLAEAVQVNNDAEEYFRVLVDRDETAQRGRMNAVAHRLKMYCELQRVDEAQIEFDKLSHDPWIWRFRAGILLQRYAAILGSFRGEHAQAVTQYESFLQTITADANPSRIEAYAQLLWESACISQRAGLPEQARRRLRLACALPDAPANHVWKRKALHQLRELERECS